MVLLIELIDTTEKGLEWSPDRSNNIIDLKVQISVISCEQDIRDTAVNNVTTYPKEEKEQDG